GWCRRCGARPMRSAGSWPRWTAATFPPVPAVRPPGGWRTCCPQGATSTRSTPRPYRRRWRGTSAKAWPPGSSTAMWPTPGGRRLAGFDDDPRVFGAKPGAYGSGILPLIESRDWRSDDDLAAVYLAWGGWSYGRAGMGQPAGEAMRRRLTAVDVAVKHQDNR